MNYCDKIKHIRNKLIFSQQMLADKIGVSFATVNRWEKGKTIPNYEARRKIERLCAENNITMEEV
ncbi:MAG: helix-turn-helix transcriptional regulator [Clostridia bacterium]|jgi:DNA-binding XRE family transcriptional regulator|nr:helix-turn-helix transcriptional regulator [Clostridia bacterium]MDD3232043.1 helix-turn-helix transcriptional regulator [Clostridia bacterium]MDD3862600.1 helix-turn-helix transcriptional regulator [Clostridia bacterium]